MRKTGILLLTGIWVWALTGCQTAGKIHLSWDAVSDPQVGGYTVFYGTSPGNYEKSIDVYKPEESPEGVVNYTLAGLKKGKTYYLAVASYSWYDKIHNRSPLSGEVTAVAK